MSRSRLILVFVIATGLANNQTSALADVQLFSRHVSAVLGRLGCNSGTCHGAVQGKNGFRLSLFAADPGLDFDQIARASRGRRLNLSAPEESLLLQKGTARIVHGGGHVLSVGSPEYEIIYRWIAAGAPPDDFEASQVVALELTPSQQTISQGTSYQLHAVARFADGTKEDVSKLCRFESLDRAVATVDRKGRVTASGIGDTTIIVRYRSEPAAALVMVPRSGGEPWNVTPALAEQSLIDRHILAKLERLNIPRADTTDDATFLRRACLDVTGELPTAQEVRAFLVDSDPNKRTRKIDELLSRPGHAALWTLKFCDLLHASQFGVYADALSLENDAPRFQAWIRARLEEDIPYDELAARILLATSREGRSLDDWQAEVVTLFEGANEQREDVAAYAKRHTLDLYWQRAESTGVSGALQVAHSFLGLRLECAQCHRHPHDVWQQDDLLSFANFVNRVRIVGFQDGNEKKYPEVAERFKQLNERANATAEEAKKLKEQFPDYERKVKEARDAKDDVRVTAAEKEFEDFRGRANKVETTGRNLEEVARRMLQAEVRHLPDPKLYASITSPLGTQKSESFRLLGAREPVLIAQEEDPRQKLVEWLRQPDNPYFARAIVSRVWAHYFGRGLVNPADDLSPLNPPSHPELLAELSREFIANGYRLKWLHLQILASRTYQHSSQPSGATAADRTNFAYSYFRRLPAEVLIDAIDQATGTTEKMDMQYYRWPEKMKAVEIPYEPQNAYIVFMLQQFGRPKRASSVQCDCERDANPSVLQVLSLANHPRILEKIAAPEGTLSRIVKEHADEVERIDEIFLTVVSRFPNDDERAACQNHIAQAESPEAGLRAVMWSLLNTKEFLLQH